MKKKYISPATRPEMFSVQQMIASSYTLKMEGSTEEVEDLLSRRSSFVDDWFDDEEF